MSDDNGDQPQTSPFNIPEATTIDRRDDAQFNHEIKRLIDKAEAIRVKHMNKHQLNKNIGLTISLIAMIGGATGFGWFLLMQSDPVKAFACMALGIILPIIANNWIKSPLNAYINDYKTIYMPELADLMGGFAYHPARGINENVIKKTGTIPAYHTYHSEDCFRGMYKGSKVLFSEARLFDKKKLPVFKGLFVLLELPNKIFEGHTIITADRYMADEYKDSRWRKLTQVPLKIEQKKWDRFVCYSDRPEDASLILGEKLIKELAEADAAFGNANLSAVLFRGKYIFMMVPHETDMFEASDLYVPVSTQRHALACKKEIDQLLELIDVFDLYAAQSE